MNLNASNLSHPRVQWELESAMWRAIEYGAAIVCNAAGDEIVSVIHDRTAIPAFAFYRNCVDVTPAVLKVLRSRS